MQKDAATSFSFFLFLAQAVRNHRWIFFVIAQKLVKVTACSFPPRV